MNIYRPHPSTRALVREALSHYRYGLSSTELRRRCARGGGLVHGIAEDGTNRTEELDVVIEYLLDNDLIQQRLVGRSVRFVDCVKFPNPTTTDSETNS